MLAASRFVAAGRAITASLRAESAGCQNQDHRKAQYGRNDSLPLSFSKLEQKFGRTAVIASGIGADRSF
jgi:hypothetical protein